MDERAVVGSGLAAGHPGGEGLREVTAGLLFAAGAAVGAAGVGVMVGAGALPVPDGAGFVRSVSGFGAAALGAWMAVVALGSLVLPAATLAVWGRHAVVRRALAPYLAVLVAQVAVEIFFSGVFFPDVVVLTGIVFTGYRLRQLLRARRSFAAADGPSLYGRTAVRCCLSVGLALWSANLAFLVFVALPRAVGVL